MCDCTYHYVPKSNVVFGGIYLGPSTYNRVQETRKNQKSSPWTVMALLVTTNNASFFHFQTSSTVTSWNLWISKSNTQKIKNSKITQTQKKGTNNYKTLNISTPPKPTMGSTTQKYSLKWNDFTVNVASTFRDLHSRHDFVDVTLACADGSTLEAHKVILSSVSSYFRDILKVSIP